VALAIDVEAALLDESSVQNCFYVWHYTTSFLN